MTDTNYGNYTTEELEELEDELLEKDYEDREEEMVVDGRSVFEIDRLKKERSGDKDKD